MEFYQNLSIFVQGVFVREKKILSVKKHKNGKSYCIALHVFIQVAQYVDYALFKYLNMFGAQNHRKVPLKMFASEHRKKFSSR